MEQNQENTTPIPSQPLPSNTKNNSLGIPIAIIIAAALIAGAIYLNGNANTPTPVPAGNNTNQEQVTPETTVRPVDDTDHILGNPNAPIILVEYSDYDCPFCKNFHETMNRIMSEFGQDGKVAWVYRHFPIRQLHPNSPKIAEAAECVASLGGNESFWSFSDSVFEKRAQNTLTDMSKLSIFAADAGVNVTEFEKCLADGTYTQSILESVQEAADAGARGTPHTIVLVGNQEGVINGAQPYETVKQIVSDLIKQIDNAGNNQ